MSKNKRALPKRIGGVKVPKTVRKGRLGALLASKAGQALIAEALMAAATVVVAKKAKAAKGPDKSKSAGEKVRDGGKAKAAKAGAASAALTYALGEAVRSFSDALRAGEPAQAETTPDPKPKWRPAPKGPLNGAAPSAKRAGPAEPAAS